MKWFEAHRKSKEKCAKNWKGVSAFIASLLFDHLLRSCGGQLNKAFIRNGFFFLKANVYGIFEYFGFFASANRCFIIFKHTKSFFILPFTIDRTPFFSLFFSSFRFSNSVSAHESIEAELNTFMLFACIHLIRLQFNCEWCTICFGADHESRWILREKLERMIYDVDIPEIHSFLKISHMCQLCKDEKGSRRLIFFLLRVLLSSWKSAFFLPLGYECLDIDLNHKTQSILMEAMAFNWNGIFFFSIHF